MIPGMLASPPPDAEQPQQAQFIAPSDMGAIQELHNEKLRVDRQKEEDKKDVDSLQKKFDLTQDFGQRAVRSIPQIKLARELVEHPQFYSGIGADAIIGLKRLQSALGWDPKAASPNEVFNKIISGGVLDDIKTVLQGTGQVRVSEIDLLRQASGNQYITKEANRAVLDLAEKLHKQANVVARVTNAYKMGYTFDDKGNPVALPGAKSSAGLENEINRALDKYPVMTPEERAAFIQRLTTDKVVPKSRKGRGAISTSPPPVGPAIGNTLPPGITPD